ELTGWRPHGDVLVPGAVVIADERHFIEADGKNVEPARGQAPSQVPRHHLAVAALHLRVMLSPHAAADLELSLAAIPAGDHAVHEDARVALQVSGLGRVPEQAQPQV